MSFKGCLKGKPVWKAQCLSSKPILVRKVSPLPLIGGNVSSVWVQCTSQRAAGRWQSPYCQPIGSCLVCATKLERLPVSIRPRIPWRDSHFTQPRNYAVWEQNLIICLFSPHSRRERDRKGSGGIICYVNFGDISKAAKNVGEHFSFLRLAAVNWERVTVT